MATCLTLKTLTAMLALWVPSSLKQRYTRTCVGRAVCCIWWALKQFICAMSVGGRKSSAPEFHGTCGMLFGSQTYWWISFLLQLEFPLGMAVHVSSDNSVCLAPEGIWLSGDAAWRHCSLVGIHRWSPLRLSTCIVPLVNGTNLPGLLISKYMHEE